MGKSFATSAAWVVRSIRNCAVYWTFLFGPQLRSSPASQLRHARREVSTVEGMKIEVRILSPDDWQLWRSVRLAALTEAPDAFGSRLHDWADAAENRWRERLTIPGAVDVVAIETETNAPVGMVTGTPDPSSMSPRSDTATRW